MNNLLRFKLFGMGSLSLLAANQQAMAQQADIKNKPNILLILADDMGYSDLGCYGSEINTPNLDRLASEGIQMTQFYNASRSCPSRASLLTGLYQHQAGVGDMDHDMRVPSYQGHINNTCVTLAEALKTNGYKTYISGKWHVGETTDSRPYNRGFDRAFSLIDGYSNYFKPGKQSRWVLDDNPWSAPNSSFYITNTIGDFAGKYIEEDAVKSQPFFMYLAFTAPHWPLQALPQDIAKYRGKYMAGWVKLREQRFQRMKKLGILSKNTTLSPIDPNSPDWESLSQKDKEMWDLRMAVYAAMVDRMDQNIGKVIKKLKDVNKLENTLIIFLSDNGGCYEKIKDPNSQAETGTPESLDSYEIPWANVSNTPFRLYKKWEHEGGTSTPFIAWWPGEIKHRLESTTGHIIDIMPTCIEAAKGIYPKECKGNIITPEEGISLLPLFKGGKVTRTQPIYWEHEGNMAIRDGKWKLVSQYNAKEKKAGSWELYDMDANRSETNNVSAKYPKKVKELTAKWDAWAKRVGVVFKER